MIAAAPGIHHHREALVLREGALGIVDDREAERDQLAVKRWKTPAISVVLIGGLGESRSGCKRMPR